MAPEGSEWSLPPSLSTFPTQWSGPMPLPRDSTQTSRSTTSAQFFPDHSRTHSPPSQYRRSPWPSLHTPPAVISKGVPLFQVARALEDPGIISTCPCPLAPNPRPWGCHPTLCQPPLAAPPQPAPWFARSTAVLSTSPVLPPSSGEDSQLHLAVSTWTNTAGAGFHSLSSPSPPCTTAWAHASRPPNDSQLLGLRDKVAGGQYWQQNRWTDDRAQNPHPSEGCDSTSNPQPAGTG